MAKLLKQSLFFFILSSLALQGISQDQAGFEWIRASQTYYKFPVVKTSVYRLDYNTLQNAGIPLASVHPKYFQLFVLGRELPIYIYGDQDGSFDHGDFIEFYARRNDGTLDTYLYADTNDQLNPAFSLISDTAICFFTWLTDTAARGLRLTDYVNTNFASYTPESYFIQISRYDHAEQYFYGRPVLSEYNYHSSEYFSGEGWSGSRFGKNSLGPPEINFNVSTAGYVPSGPLPKFRMRMMGVSDYALSAPDHHTHVFLGKDQSSLSLMVDTIFEGYRVLNFNKPLGSSQIGSLNTLFRVRMVDDIGSGVDGISVSYAEIEYPRNYDMTNIRFFEFVQQSSSTASDLLFHFSSYTGSAAYLYDLSSGHRIKGNYDLPNNLRFLCKRSASGNKLVLFDTADVIHIPLLTQVVMPQMDPSENYEYLIITHKTLLPKASEYAAYRSLKYKVLLITTDELENYYSYGLRHPLSIRRFASHILSKASVKPQYLLLIGRGLQGDYVRSPQHQWLNLVPQIGVPSSDIKFTCGLDSTVYEPAIPTGRIPAITNADIDNYLEKIKYMEGNPDSIKLWRKNILHLGGGDGGSQQQEIAINLAQNEALVRGPQFGAQVKSFYKSTTSPVEAGLKLKIVESINSGLNMLNFFGHGSLNILDIDIGSYTDLSNKDRYPLFYFNGCNVGNISADLSGGVAVTGVAAPGYLFSKDRGVVGWLAQSNTSIVSYLAAQNTAFYEASFTNHYGGSIGRIIKETLKNFQAPGNEISQSHCHQYIYLGDPAYHLYSPSLPDYEIKDNDLYMQNHAVSATSDSFAIAVIAHNLGKAVNTGLEISVLRNLPQGKTVSYPARLMKPVFNTDTLLFYISSKDPNTAGMNTFTVSLDPAQKLNELNELNNTATFSFFIPGNSIHLLQPSNYGITNSTKPTLLVQAQDIFSSNVAVIFEIDTSPAFSPASSFYQHSGIISSTGSLCKWLPDLPSNDSIVYFWRARLNLPPDKGGNWVQSSFRLIKAVSSGWSQAHFAQYYGVEPHDIELDTIQRKFLFVPIDETIEVVGARWRHAGLGIKTTTSQFLTHSAGGPCFSYGGIILILFDSNTLDIKLGSRYPYNCINVTNFNLNNYPGIYYYTFEMTKPEERAGFASFVDSLEHGVHAAIFFFYNPSASKWEEGVYKAFEKLGSGQARNMINDSMTMSFIGQKGAPIGSATEKLIYNPYFGTGSGSNPADTLVIGIKKTIRGRWKLGYFDSEWIGPAISWDRFYSKFKKDKAVGSETRLIDVIGKDHNNTETVLISSINADSFTLAGVDAALYPYIRLRAHLTDDSTRSPLQLQEWTVLYEAPPEGTLNPQAAYSFHSKSLQEGDSLRFEIAFQNISQSAFDTLLLKYELTDDSRIVKYASSEKSPPLPKGDTLYISKNISTLGLSGNHTLNLLVNPAYAQPEQTIQNNVLNVPFTVIGDKVNPLMDVFFDGTRIMNGDIVSPTPSIMVTLKDENKFLKITDTSSLQLSIKKPGQSIFTPVLFSDPHLSFIPASGNSNQAKLQYKPSRLADGIYTLRLITKDASGNLAGSKAYEISFTVINESTVTNFLPYPNPCTSNMRFVFTLTGDNIPDQLRVQIMTVTGRVVREVTASELGPLRIGNNISQFAWDGTDQYGDRLANGVYLYRVNVRYQGQELKHRDSSMDQFFKKQTGKIYLMR